MIANSSLTQQQNKLLESIFAINNIAIKAINTPVKRELYFKNRGLQTYQANAKASAARSLLSAYPVIAQLIGDETFTHLATDYWAKYPPLRGDLAQWGGELAAFITSIQALQTEPYLSDVAKVEWCLHTAANAPDKEANFASFSLLTSQEPDTLTLQLTTGTALIRSEYPIASILMAHLYNSPSFDDVGQKLRDGTPEIAMVWRRGFQPRVMACTANESAFIASLLAGKSLLTALEDATLRDEAALDFHQWLQKAVELGLVVGAQLLHSAPLA